MLPCCNLFRGGMIPCRNLFRAEWCPIGLFMTLQNHVKKFSGLSIPLKNRFSKWFACKNYTTKGPNESCLQSPLAENFFCSAAYHTPRNNVCIKNYRRIRNRIKTKLGWNLESIWDRSWKNQRPKVLCYCPFICTNYYNLRVVLRDHTLWSLDLCLKMVHNRLHLHRAETFCLTDY